MIMTSRRDVTGMMVRKGELSPNGLISARWGPQTGAYYDAFAVGRSPTGQRVALAKVVVFPELVELAYRRLHLCDLQVVHLW